LRVAQAAKLQSSREILKAQGEQRVTNANNAFKDAMVAAKAAKNAAIAESNAAVELKAEQLGQYSTNLEHLEESVLDTNLTQDPAAARKKLAVFGELLGDLENAQLDSAVGLAVDPGEASMVSIHKRPDLVLGAEAGATVSISSLVS
jgi:putative ubiquitin-RnfH superfamily antitoxin RatB of RatAB toxin-antitoxin module